MTHSYRLLAPDRAFVSSFLDALSAGPFSHMALDAYGDWPVRKIVSDPDDYLELLNNRTPRLIRTPNGHEFILRNHQILWVIDQDDQFVGSAVLRKDATNPLVNYYAGHLGLSIRHDKIGSGIATALIPQLKSKFQPEKFSHIIISAEPGNTRSINLIISAGGNSVCNVDCFGYGLTSLFFIST